MRWIIRTDTEFWGPAGWGPTPWVVGVYDDTPWLSLFWAKKARPDARWEKV